MFKKLLLSIFILPVTIAFGQDDINQDTIYLNTYMQEVQKTSFAFYYKVVLPSSQNTVENIYYKSGQIYSQKNYSNYQEKILEGEHKEWYKNGQLSLSAFYQDNKKEGELFTYWENGNLKREEKYQNDKFLLGKCYDSTGTEIPFFDYEVMAKFPGGEGKFRYYIASSLKYPREALEKGAKGTVLVEFVMDEDGFARNISVLKSDHNLLNKEAMRIIEQMPKWEPAYKDGEPTYNIHTVSISFQME